MGGLWRFEKKLLFKKKIVRFVFFCNFELCYVLFVFEWPPGKRIKGIKGHSDAGKG